MIGVPSTASVLMGIALLGVGVLMLVIIIKNMFCKNCGNKVGNDEKFCESCGNKINDTDSKIIGDTSKRGESIKLSKRVVSGIIDVVFYIAVSGLISIIFTGKIDNLPDYLAWLPICAYVGVFHCYLNWTLGMKIMGYKFVNSDNLSKPTNWKLILRFVCAFILRFSLLFGFIAILTFNEDSGFYWDRWFKIKVVRIEG